MFLEYSVQFSLQNPSIRFYRTLRHTVSQIDPVLTVSSMNYSNTVRCYLDVWYYYSYYRLGVNSRHIR